MAQDSPKEPVPRPATAPAERSLDERIAGLEDRVRRLEARLARLEHDLLERATIQE